MLQVIFPYSPHIELNWGLAVILVQNTVVSKRNQNDEYHCCFGC